MATVTFEHVTKKYGDVLAVDDLQLAINDGEFMVLVGPSGCGKTTSLRMIAGLEEISAGQLKIGDRVVNDVPPKDRDIAMVFQSYALYPHMSVYDNLAFGLKLRKVPKKEVDERVRRAAKILQIDEFLKRKPRALSGGQRQRVAMGRAIVREPQAYLMDEPLSNLDAKLRVQMRAEIHQLQRRLGVTTLLVTHDQEEALSLSDRIMVLNHGKTQQVAAPAEAYLKPANRFVAEFLGIANFVGLDGGRTGLVRPERVRLEPPGVNGGRPARVIEAIYLGQMVRYHLALDGEGAPMVAAMPFVGRAWQAGEPVAVSWDAADIWPVV
jgi:ABC-type sugar transport system ATPase subunit